MSKAGRKEIHAFLKSDRKVRRSKKLKFALIEIIFSFLFLLIF